MGTIQHFCCRKATMKFSSILVISFLLVGTCLGRQRKGSVDNEDKGKVQERDGKIFSLFSIVQFKNTACQSSVSLASGSTQYRNGTCYTQSECSNKGGSAKGNCAAGFGVCCVFLYDDDSQTQINYNDTYIQNPNYPSTYGESNSITYTVNKCSDDICWLRLDFETFTMEGPTATDEGATTAGTGACKDTFTVTSSTSSGSYPVICGDNTGQHIYVDIGNESSGTATLAFAFTGASTQRKWDIKVAQIQCGTRYTPSEGCFQEHRGYTGTIKSFNFNTAAGPHLENQNYAACVRREAGMCCVEYSVCTDTNSNTLDNRAVPNLGQSGKTCKDGKAATGTAFSGDYIEIAGSGATCGQTLGNYYCGGVLNVKAAATEGTDQNICDCTEPFSVRIVTNNINEAKSATVINRGICLNYRQIPCTNSIGGNGGT